MDTFGFLFPGQGAQRAGMGAELCQRSPAARGIFDRANRALGFDLARVCFDGPDQELQRTDISQPAILTMSLAVLEALREAGKVDESGCRLAAGLSLGEYTALAAAGALSIEDAMCAVYERGRYMQEACDLAPGGMASIIGLPESALEEICRIARAEGEIVPANYNSPDQIVLSGARKAIDSACELARQRGGKVYPLKVAGAFHSPLMTPAARKLEPLLRRIDFRPPRFPIVANVTGALVTDPGEIRANLIRQVDHPVRWAQCMQTALGAGVRDYLEVGPGKVLAGLMRKIEPSAVVRSLSTAEEMASL
jgi:[acyl-carrier-protein] S-malonyltransferase